MNATDRTTQHQLILAELLARPATGLAATDPNRPLLAEIIASRILGMGCLPAHLGLPGGCLESLIQQGSRHPFQAAGDDIERAKKFYDGVFDWGFNSYGQGDFVQIRADKSENGELIGAMQSRKYSPITEKIIGLECTIGVENIDETIEKVITNGGYVLMPKTSIPYVGYIAKFLDTEGNLICGMQYDNAAR